MNIYCDKKKIAIVAIDGNSLAKEIAKEMEAQGMKNVTLIEGTASYKNYYTLAQLKPDYVMFVNESNQCKLKVTKIEGIVGDKLGHYATRKTDVSKDAMNYYKHELRMIGIAPRMIGAEEIPFKDVKDISWFYESNAPMIHLYLPKSDAVVGAVVQATRDYLKAVGKVGAVEKESDCGCKSKIRGAVDRK